MVWDLNNRFPPFSVRLDSTREITSVERVRAYRVIETNLASEGVIESVEIFSDGIPVDVLFGDMDNELVRFGDMCEDLIDVADDLGDDMPQITVGQPTSRQLNELRAQVHNDFTQLRLPRKFLLAE